MPYDIPIPETKTFRLELLDQRMGIPDAEQTSITVKQATLRENAKRSELFRELIQEKRQDGSERTIVLLPLYTLAETEVRLTLVDCNLTRGGKPLFRFGKSPSGQYLNMTEKEFSLAWGTLDDETAAEIHSKVLEQNPHWIFSDKDTSLGEDF